MSAPAAAFFDLDRTLVSVASPKIFQRHLSAAGFGTPVDGTWPTSPSRSSNSSVSRRSWAGRRSSLPVQRRLAGRCGDCRSQASSSRDRRHVSDFARAELAMHRDADAPSCSPPPRRSTLFGPSPTSSASTTSSPRGGPRPTAHSPAGSMATSSGARANETPCCGGVPSTTSIRRAVGRTPTAITTRPLDIVGQPSPSTPMSAWPPPPPSTAGRSVRSTSPTACRPWVARTPGPVPSVPAARTHSQRRRHRLGPRTHPPRGRRNHRRQPPELLRPGRDDHDGGEVGPQRPLPGQEGSLRHSRDRSAPASGWWNPGRPGHKDEGAFDAAAAAVRGGDVVVMFPQGTIPRGQAFFDPVLKGRWGAARSPP